MTRFAHALLPLFAAFALFAGDGWLGIYLADTPRATVGEVVPDSPAAKAGVLPGDVITAVDGVATDSAEALEARIQALDAGASIKLSIERGAERLTLTVVLGEKPAAGGTPGDAPRVRAPVGRPAAPAPESAPARPWLGMVLASTDAGLRVEELAPEGPAQVAGIRIGDVLRAIGDREVRGWDALDAALRQLTPGQAVAIRVARGDADVRVELTVGATAAPQAQPDGGAERARAELERLRAEQRRLAERLEVLGRRIDELQRRLERAAQDG